MRAGHGRVDGHRSPPDRPAAVGGHGRTGELSESVEDISRKISQSGQAGSNPVGQVRMSEDMGGGLLATAGRIGDVTKLITNIASKTNLLALGATIEGRTRPRGGQRLGGRALEVKSLARQTTKATGESGQQIKESQEASRITAEAIHEIGRITSGGQRDRPRDLQYRLRRDRSGQQDRPVGIDSAVGRADASRTGPRQCVPSTRQAWSAEHSSLVEKIWGQGP